MRHFHANISKDEISFDSRVLKAISEHFPPTKNKAKKGDYITIQDSQKVISQCVCVSWSGVGHGFPGCSYYWKRQSRENTIIVAREALVVAK
jgi:hypothetical protein